MARTARIGRVSSIDYGNGTVSVLFDGQETAGRQLPMLSFGGEYRMPSPGSRVAVACDAESPGTGVVLGEVWDAASPPPASGEGVYRKDFSRSGECHAAYDDDTGELEIASAGIRFTDGEYSATLSDILRRLETLDGDASARR